MNHQHSIHLSHAAIADALRKSGCVFAEDEARMLMAHASTSEELKSIVEQRIDGLPLEYILGWAEFFGLRLVVEPGVFVPRRRTEFLLRQAIRVIPEAAVVVDLCCGSGALGAGLLAVQRNLTMHAVDIDPRAVHCARQNLPDHARVYQGDLYQPLPLELRGSVDVLVTNAPYVPTEAIALLPQEARVYEARMALDGGLDGLDIQRRIVASAPTWLAPGGHLLMETSSLQAHQTLDLFVTNGLDAQIAHSTSADATVVIGKKASVSSQVP